MEPGYQALRESAAYLDFSTRGRIFVTGEDRVRLLHAMTTNHIQQLQPGQGCYAFFLNAQGRIVADVNVFVLPDRLLLDVEPELREKVYEHLDKFIIADDATLEDVSGSLISFGCEGPKAEEALLAMGAPIPESPYSHVDWMGGIVARVTATGAPGFRIFAPEAPKIALDLADADSVRVVRLEHAKPRYGEDIFDTTLPQETQQSHALHFSKGCYIGQEIVERIRTRGSVHRGFTGLVVNGPVPPSGTPIQAHGKDIGLITSTATVPAREGDRVIALGFVRKEHLSGGVVFEVAGAEAIPVPLPFSGLIEQL